MVWIISPHVKIITASLCVFSSTLLKWSRRYFIAKSKSGDSKNQTLIVSFTAFDIAAIHNETLIKYLAVA